MRCNAMSRRRTEQGMGGHAHFAWHELLTTDMAAARSSVKAFWDGPRTMPRHRSLLTAFSTPVMLRSAGSWSCRWGGGGGRLARRLQGFILPPLWGDRISGATSAHGPSRDIAPPRILGR